MTSRTLTVSSHFVKHSSSRPPLSERLGCGAKVFVTTHLSSCIVVLIIIISFQELEITKEHTFYSSLTFGVIVLHVTLRLIADLSSPFLSLFADWSCLSFLQNVV